MYFGRVGWGVEGGVGGRVVAGGGGAESHIQLLHTTDINFSINVSQKAKLTSALQYGTVSKFSSSYEFYTEIKRNVQQKVQVK